MAATEAANQAIIITEPAWQRERRQMLAAAGGSTERSVLLRLSLQDQQLRQIEQATSHQEHRQHFYTGSLPADRDRHMEQFKAEIAAARQSRDVGRQAVIQSRYQTYRRDWLHMAVSRSCFAFCEAWWRLPKGL